MATTGPTNIGHYQRVSLTLKNRSDGGATDITVHLTNRHLPDTAPSEHWPILLSAGGWGVSMGTFLPEPLGTQVVIDDSAGSLGFERRFSDLLARYTPINQTISLQYAYANSDYRGTFSWTTLWYGTCIGVQRSDDRISLEVSSVGVPTWKMTRTLSADDDATIPIDSVGADLPLVFGEGVEVVPVCMAVNAARNEASYAFGTNLGNSFLVKSLNSVKVLNELSAEKNSRQEWTQVTSASWASPSTAVYASGTTLGGTGNYYWQHFQNFGEEITVSSAYLCSGAWVRFRGTGDGAYNPSNAKFHISIYQDDLKGYPNTEVAKGEVAKSTYLTELRLGTGTTFDVHVKFDKFVHVGGISGMKYYIIFEQDYNTPPEASNPDPVVHANRSGSGQTVYGIPLKGSTVGGYTPETTTFSEKGSQTDWAPIWGIYGVAFTYSSALGYGSQDSDHLGIAKADFKYYDNAASQTGPDLSQVSMVFDVDGLRDDGTGFATGVGYDLVTRVDHVLTMLGARPDPGFWDISNTWMVADSTTYDYSTPLGSALSFYYRQLNGYIPGPASLADVLAEICRNAATRIVRRNAADSTEAYSFWLWGGLRDPVAVFTDENSKVIGWEVLRPETIINQAKIYYHRRHSIVDAQRTARTKDFREYTGLVYEYYSGTGWYSSEEARTYFANSFDLYGQRLAQAQDYPLLNTEASARCIFRYLAATYAHPFMMVTLEADFIDFGTVEALQIVEVLSPSLPAYWGTSTYARWPTYSGTTVTMSDEQYPKRAERYRAIVEGKEIFFSEGGVPRVRFTLRLLQNYPTDPT